MLQINSPRTTEGGTLTFLVSLTLPAQGGERVWYSTRYSTGTATGGIDFTEIEGFLDWIAGETQKTITVQTNADTAIEGEEWLVLEYDTADFEVDAFWALGTIDDNQSHTPNATITIKANQDLGAIAKVTGTVTDLDGFADLRSPDIFLEVPISNPEPGTPTHQWLLISTGGALLQVNATTGSWEQFVNLGTYTPGSYRIAARPYDQDWESGTTAVTSFVIDSASNLAPIVDFTLNKASYTSGETISLTGTLSDPDGLADVELVRLYLDGTPLTDLPIAAALTYQLPTTGLTTSNHNLQIIATDEAATAQKTVNFTIALPLQPPTITINLSATSIAPTTTLTYSGAIADPDTANPTSTFTLKQGTTTLRTIHTTTAKGNYSQPFDLRGLAPNTYNIQGSVNDGNTTVQQQQTFTVTNAAPVATQTLAGNAASGAIRDDNGLATLTTGQLLLIAPGGGTTTIANLLSTYTGGTSAGNGNYQGSYSHTINTAGLQSGSYTVRTSLLDGSGLSSQINNTLIIPNLAPTLSFNLSKTTYAPTESVAWTGTISDGDDPTVTLAVQRITPAATLSTNSAQALGNYSGSSSLLGYAPGTYTLRAIVQDETANAQIDRTLTVTNEAPTVTISGTSVSGTTVTFTATVTDNNGIGDVSSIEVLLGSTTLTTTPGSGTYYTLGTPTTINGQSHSRTVTVYNLPIANNQTITYRANSGSLNGQGTTTISISNPNLLNLTSWVTYPTQDGAGTTTNASNTELKQTGNNWKALAINKTLTTNTVLKFDFKSDAAAEVSAIGFDTNGQWNNTEQHQTPEWFWRIAGRDSWPVNLTFDNQYTIGSGWKTYEIPVGALAGTWAYLIFSSDDDTQGSGISEWRNVEFIERQPPTLTQILSSGSYAPNESVSATITISDPDTATVNRTTNLRNSGNTVLQTANGSNSGTVVFSLLNLAPGTYNMETTANDGVTAAVVDVDNFTITNAAPTVAISGTSVTGSTVTFTATTTDTNGGNDINAIELRRAGTLLTTTPGAGTYYTLGTPTITGSTRTQTVTVYNMPVGANQALEYRAISGTLNGNGTATVTITAPAAQPPTLTQTLSKTSYAPTESVSATLTITDPDTATVNRTSQLRSGTTVLATTNGTNSGTVPFSLSGLIAGTYNVYSTANDGTSTVTDTDNFTVTNVSPTVTANLANNGNGNYTVSGTIADNNSLIQHGGQLWLEPMSGQNGGNWINVGNIVPVSNTGISSTYSNSFSTAGYAAGTWRVHVYAWDVDPAVEAPQNPTFTIAAANQPPTITTNGNQTHTPSLTAPIVITTATFSDPEGQTITSSAELRNGQGAAVRTFGNQTGNSRSFSWQTWGLEGTYTSRVTASDGTNTTVKTDTITVLNAAPTIKAFVTEEANKLYINTSVINGKLTTSALAIVTDLNRIGDVNAWTFQYRQGTGAWVNVSNATFSVANPEDSTGNLSGSLDTTLLQPGTTYEFRATASDEAATATATTTFTIGKPIIYQGAQITDSTPDFIGYKMAGIRVLDAGNNLMQMAWRDTANNLYTASVNYGTGQWVIGSWSTTTAASESVFLQDLNLDGRISGTVASGKDNVENAGSIGLNYNNGYALRDGANVITIKADGTQITDSFTPGYKLVGIERTASPTTAHTYDAIWRSDALNAWASWKVGSSGERVFGSWTDLTIAQVQGFETAFRQDLSGDFRIGSNTNNAWIDTIDVGAAYSNGYVMI